MLRYSVIVLTLANVLIMGTFGCNGSSSWWNAYIDPENAPKARDKGWIPLCNGKDLTGWLAKDKSVPMSWKVVDGMMVNTSSHGHHGTDLYTEQKFDDFEIYYEYRIPECSNSGLYLRGRYEVQILDNACWKEKHKNLGSDQLNGAIYGVQAVPEDASRGPGEWQSVYAKLIGKKLTLILNGRKIHDNYELPRATAGGLDRAVGEPGAIMIQGNHGSIDVRKMMIRPIKESGCCAK